MSTELAIIEPSEQQLQLVNNRHAQIVDLWIAGRSPNTQRAYRADATRLFTFTNKPLYLTDLADLQAFAEHLAQLGLAAQTIKRILAAVKSLFSFASQDGVGLIKGNAAKALRLPSAKNTINERILTEDEVQKLIDAAKPGRDQFMIELIYRIGARVEEVVNLRWRDAQPAGDGGIVTLFGKGSKTRFIRLPADDWLMLAEWRKPGDADDDWIIRSHSGKHLSKMQAWRIVHEAAIAAGLKPGVSPHWLRHAHASHAIDNGADLRTVQMSLGHSSATTTEGYIHARPRESSGSFLPRFKRTRTLPTSANVDVNTPPTSER